MALIEAAHASGGDPEALQAAGQAFAEAGSLVGAAAAAVQSQEPQQQQEQEEQEQEQEQEQAGSLVADERGGPHAPPPPSPPAVAQVYIIYIYMYT